MSFLLMLGTLLVGSFAIAGGDSGEDVIAIHNDEEPGEDLLEIDDDLVALGEWLVGGDDADDMTGTDGDDTIFGGDGADMIEGGAGDDQLFSGSDDTFRDDWFHAPGDLTRVDDSGDVLDGGAGNDELWLGQGTVATGGEGADLFHAFGATCPEEAEAADIILCARALQDVIGEIS